MVQSRKRRRICSSTKFMIIEYNKTFLKNYKKRISSNLSLVDHFQKRIKLFISDRKNPILKDHALKGKMTKMRAFSITGDIRVIYTIFNDTIYFFDIGTHNQVY